MAAGTASGLGVSSRVEVLGKTHDRPYKKAWTPEASAAEIGRLQGSKFDPRNIMHFQQLFREGLLWEH